MKAFYLNIVLILFYIPVSQAQDTLVSKNSKQVEMWQELGRASIAPVALTGLGVWTIGERGLYSSVDFRRDTEHLRRNFHTRADEYLKFSTLGGYGILKLTNLPSQNSYERSALLAIQSQVVMMSMVYGLKYGTGITRPDGNELSFPSGHAAQVFLGAALIDREYRSTSPWLSVVAYTLATTTGVIRVFRDQHWMSDVLVGAGIGIFSVHLTYWMNKFLYPPKPVLKRRG
ncbi:MAG: phosphatase PAP2 family protein [Cytophagaceae bacterium]